MDPRVALAIDIGGTKVAAALVGSAGRLLRRSQRPTAGALGEAAVFQTVIDAVAELGSLAGVTACGVGCAGPMMARGEEVSPLNIPSWRRYPLRRRLEAALGLPVVLDNDAKALALGEGWLGAAAGEPAFIAMVVSTGVGGGIVLDGRLLQGRTGNSGHIGHVVVEPYGRTCACGGRGCLEAEVSGTAIEVITGAAPSAAPAALRERCGRLTGLAIASVANLLDLPLAVVGGSVALGYGDTFFAAARAEVEVRCGLEYSRETRVRPAALGADGALLGAARLAFETAMPKWGPLGT